VTTIAVGDIHGFLAPLIDLLARLRAEVTADDTVVFLGDYIDRGPDSKGCIDAILAFEQDIAGTVVCLRGNHEDWLLQTLGDFCRHSWVIGMDGYDTIRSYSPDAARIIRDAQRAAGLSAYLERVPLPYNVFVDSIPKAHRTFFERLQTYYRGADGICVHAGLDVTVVQLEDQDPHVCMWGTDTFPEEYVGDEIVAYGHLNNATLDDDGWPGPRIIGSTIGLDTISHGVLTAMRLSDRRLFQSAKHDTMYR
jgi:calcineurin-like phosphoesterase family protein